MQKNVGSVDRTIRFILSAVIFLFGIIYQSWWGLLGLLPLLTAATQRCPAFITCGISTCKIEEPSKK
ncbi:MAG: DUF2892 domain-containing protein [Ignavibacteriales bacterium]|nr:DUF2892 domain-containing protein [Ignavibacteriales bacterium]